MRIIFCSLFVIFFYSINAQPKTDAFLKNILEKNKDTLFQKVLSDPNEYRLQIIYTQINRDKNNKPSFTNYYFNYDSLFYFNPASTVKLPLAILSLQKFNELHMDGVNKYTSMQFDSAYPHQEKKLYDSTSENNLPSIANFIKKAFLISDNDAYNRMYEFVGQKEINENLHSKGYNDVRITRQFMGFTE
ncbi:MAG TPA: serine hydrolase, partial [Parafilimonas sp.]|nr:serine hydrolase [Parafilimonas sp.]